MTDRAQLAALGFSLGSDQPTERDMRAEIDGACWAIAAVLDRDQIEPLTASVDRLICALADAREALADHDGSGGSWPADLGPPLRVGTLGAHVEQPAPIPGTGDVWQEVIDGEPLAVLRELYEARRALGLRRYGHLLQRDNGRDHALDGQEELLDGIAYFTAAGWYDVVAALRTALLCVVARRGAA